ncbi:hypothetical protein AALP_AAs61551U000200 [Arabis alpina]|uniref:Glycosyltransferase n=1 Tax=Arabis alpina TaxID=50452 RepID=A0A087FZS7_ARAAL|nr:hypothetical protein AALP_AAs61551U000200 [Arabis alpina]
MKIELVFIPSPGIGHLRSTVELTKQLIRIDHRLSITVIIIPYPSRTDATDSIYIESLSSTDRLRYLTISVVDTGDPTPTQIYIENQKPQVREAITKLESSKLAGFVVDMFCTSMIDLANEFGVPSYMVYTSNATFLGISLHIQEMYDEKNGGPGGGDLPQVYPIGPMLHLDNGDSEDEKQSEILRWLDEQPQNSVVFLCFGSMGGFNEEQTREIAVALDRSGQRFLWSLRRASPDIMKERPGDFTNLEEVLPEGFLERTSERGKIIGWAPQVAVLAKPAIGGFVTHCGWNSMLESLWFGVPMATWPLYAEQKANAFEMVEELGLAVEVRKYFKGDLMAGAGGMEIVAAEDIEKAIRRLMEEESDVRTRVKDMADKCHVALTEGGSSKVALRKFIQDVADNAEA